MYFLHGMDCCMEHHLVRLPLEVARERGSETYVAGPCKYGHYVARMVKDRGCTECRRQQKKLHMRKKYEDKEYREKLHKARRDRYAKDEEYRTKVLRRCKKHREENADHYRRAAREYARQNKERASLRHKEWYEKNKDYVFRYQKSYEERNPEKCRAWKAESSRDRRYRRPPVKSELDQFALEECYDLAAERTEIFGFEWQVDHMIPLQGGTVSGLHVWNNFQVIPASLNYRKKNKLMYTEPFEWLSDAVA